MPPSAIPDFVPGELAQLGLAVDAAVLESLARYLDLLLEANAQFNLTAIKDLPTAWRRHVIDCLTLLPCLREIDPALKGTASGPMHIIDVGSGGGLPGVVVALALPQVHMTLLESTGKKARFLSKCVAQLPLPRANVLAIRAETAGQESTHRERYDVALCRAVGPLREALEYLLPLVKIGGRVLAMKGTQVERELDEASDAMMVLGAGELRLWQAYPDGWPVDASIVELTKERPTPRTYPRLPGVPRQTPL